MKIAIIHYWLIKMRGGEKVIEALCEMFPDADIYTHVYDPSTVSSTIASHKIITSFIARLPFAKTLYSIYLPLMPFALRRFDLSDYDLVISSESGPAKGVQVNAQCRHICYCHTPMRYIWDLYDVYLKHAGVITGFFMRLVVPLLRRWDLKTAAGVDVFIANSEFVRNRIINIYGRDAHVVYPPVAVEDFSVADADDFYLYAGELTQYKMPQLAIEAFNQSGKKLVVIGDGELKGKLKQDASNNIAFLGRQSLDSLRYYFSHCKALIFPGIEDFGIVPVEVMASGRPIVAYRDGGALETVIEGRTGVFFDEQSPESLNMAVDRLEALMPYFDPALISAEMKKFSKSRFKREFSSCIALQ